METGIDRRDFLKGAALSGVAIAGAGLMACSPDSSKDSGEGAAIDTDADTEAAGVIKWGEFSDTGFYTPQFLIEPNPISESDIVETFDTEVLVIGMGLSGMSVARSAIEEGGQVMVLEKGETYHVHSHQFHAFNCNAARETGCETPQEVIDLIIDAEIFGFRERVDHRLWAYLLNHCGEDFDWYLSLTDKYTVIDPHETVGETSLDAKAIINICTAGLAPIAGRHFDDVSTEREQAALDAAPYISMFNHPANPNWDIFSERHPMSPGVVCIEPTHAIPGANLAAFVEANAAVKYAVWARRLLRDATTGHVNGAIYEDIDGKFYKVNASKGVVLCTGDFAGNTQMIEYYQDCHRFLEGGDLGWPDVDAKGNRTNIGEGLSMAHWIGAKVDTTHACCNDHYGGALGCNPMLFVDGKGERFMNEDVVGEILGEKVCRVAGKQIWQVFDDNFANQLANMPVGHRMYWKIVDSYDEIPMGLFLDPIGMLTRDEVTNMAQVKADSIEKLAEEMELPVETLKASVERYNELVGKGIDEDFGKRTDRLAPIKQAPFYASKMPVLGYQTFYGSVCCDNNLCVLDENNDIIPGLYVAGTIMGSRFWQIYPNTAMGMNHTGALVYGRLAGKNIVNGI